MNYDSVFDNEAWDISLCNKESDFIYNYGFNKGVKNAVTKVWRCLLLSSGAKSVYQDLSLYAYGEKRSCYPSVDRLSLDLDCDVKSIVKYTNELIEAGLIVKLQGSDGKANRYGLAELQTVTILKHSEILYAIVPMSAREIRSFKKKLKAYKESELYYKIQASGNPDTYREEIQAWFDNYVLDESTNGAGEQGSVVKIIDNSIQKRLHMAGQFAPEYDGMVKEEGIGKAKAKPKAKTGKYAYKDKAVSEWHCKDFLAYYNDTHEELYGYAFGGGEAEEGMLKRLIFNKGNNEHVKSQMDVFLRHPEVFETLSIHNFVFSKNQALLDAHVRDGKFPAYIEKKVRKEDGATSGDSIDDFFLKGE
jgi:hypothetical protein